MPKDDLIYLGHMLDTARRALTRVEGKSRAEFEADEDLQIIMAHLIQVFGEAARHVSPAFQQAHPQIPWSKIIGMRNRMVHNYMTVDLDVVWGVATVELKSLMPTLNGLVK